jgi:hypothetical protein
MRLVNAAAGATFAFTGLAAVLSIPPIGVAFDDSCRPQGFRAWVSANISSEEFWQSQPGAAQRELISLEQAPAEGTSLARVANLTRCKQVIAGH